MESLVLGPSDFEILRTEFDYIYVDKTQYVHELRRLRYCFFSRPRRFGKSLFLSMLSAFFKGRRDLFKGLALESYPHWDVYPVFYFDMGDIGEDYELSDTNVYLKIRFNEIARNYGISLEDEIKPREMFRQLIVRYHEKHGKRVVILIDEYDKPLIDRLHKPEEARVFHEYLSSFYSVIKPQSAHIEFLFITGITRFEKLNIFSGLNQLQDITLEPAFHGIAGFTEAEIRKYYGEYILSQAKKKRWTEEQFMQTLADWYNGYQWVVDEAEIEETGVEEE